MRHIYTISIDTDLEEQLEKYKTEMGYNTRSEGVIRILKRGLKYDNTVEELKKENELLDEKVKELGDKPAQISFPCSVCGKPMNITQDKDNPMYKAMKKYFKDWGHSKCMAEQEKQEGDKNGK